MMPRGSIAFQYLPCEVTASAEMRPHVRCGPLTSADGALEAQMMGRTTAATVLPPIHAGCELIIRSREVWSMR